eukprot:jgi/Chrzof1/12810/Cz07g08100.t1
MLPTPFEGITTPMDPTSAESTAATGAVTPTLSPAGPPRCTVRTRHMPKVESSRGGNEFVEYGAAWTIGHRPEMEDAHCVHLDIDGATNRALFGVFDGHGGSEVSEFCAKAALQALISTQSYRRNGGVGEALRECVMVLDEEVCKKFAQSVGTTATLALLNGNELVVAGVGDSRCVLARNGTPVVMTVDHKPDDPKEAERIQGAGGFVLWGRVGGNLNLSRAVGDSEFKKNTELPKAMQMVSPEPDIRHVTVDPANDQFMVVACDGVWNSMSVSQVLSFVYHKLQSNTAVEAIATALCHECNKPGRSAHDNVTAIIVTFKPSLLPTGNPVVVTKITS